MSQTVHLSANNFPGYGASEGRLFSNSRFPGRVLTVCPSHSDLRICSRINIGLMKCATRAVPFSCKASSSGHRRNPDFPRQNKQGFSRNRNRQNDQRDSFENLDESDLLSSKNGPLLSLSSNPRSQATAAPGPREKEIVELFRKVQAQLQERAAVKEDKKVESSNGKVKQSETVDSLLKLLRKHSAERGKKKASSGSSSQDIDVDQPEHDEPYSVHKSTNFSNLNKRRGNESLGTNATSVTRPPSNFRRRSPVPQIKYPPVNPNEDPVSPRSLVNVNGERKQQFETQPNSAEQLKSVPELEMEEDVEIDSELELDPHSSFHDDDVFDELSDRESSEVVNSNEDGAEELTNEPQDVSSLKLTELRALAKSRGIKGVSKMKKGELVELLNSSSI
ncbi:hypothetical protein K2173_018382 [Erythroxylum novogranatense]|uniref:Rho termination factor-like N-terminal domain-containing protein n=1 Tax=Erythroxylum novogranatense TaxID=1862640 RepID=A0AAV8UE76_9ROSI|nr:hypothetical protein K2173_018382 [Erythroxylum novogranatense]